VILVDTGVWLAAIWGRHAASLATLDNKLKGRYPSVQVDQLS
jgi:predicted nucleic acid-binding protein